MNDPTNSWEDDWRDELAGYEAPQQADDWAGMEALLAGGSAAPAEPSPPGPAATGYATWLKGLAFVLALASAGGLGYFLNGESFTDQPITAPTKVTDTLPTGFRYYLDTVYQSDAKGNLTQRIDTSLVPLRQAQSPGPRTEYSATTEQLPTTTSRRVYYDILYDIDEEGNMTDEIAHIDSVVVERPVLSGTTGRSLNEVPETSLPAFPTLPAPAAAPPLSLPNAPGKTRIVPKLRWPKNSLPTTNELLRKRLLRAGQDQLSKITPAPISNGYFPPVRN